MMAPAKTILATLIPEAMGSVHCDLLMKRALLSAVGRKLRAFLRPGFGKA
jgi:hypothetical protein